MTQRFRTIEGIFYSALKLAPEQVSAFLDTACQGDVILRSEVEALLVAYEPARGFIQTSAMGLAAKVFPNTPADARTGLRMGHYELGDLIGTGGMGEVYRATDILAGRKAALKLLPTRYTGDLERVDRFAQEARAAVALNHPNILTIYEIGKQDSIHYIASELIDGETLRQRLVRGPMGAEEAIEVAIQVASALQAAHEAGIVHRDIKPENIMLRPDGYVKVLDFGIAKLAQESVPISPGQEETIFLVETHLGAILGTARYMAPEQVRAAPVGPEADIWGLGVVLYEMLSGRTPFTGETAQEVMHAILTTEPAPLTDYLTNTRGHELQPIVERMLRKSSAERYLDAGELIKALKAARRSMELGAEREKLTSVISSRPWKRLAVAVSLGTILIAYALAFYWQRNPATSPSPEKSVAVMPFVNLSGDMKEEYLSDGMTEELLTDLAQVKGLRVPGRSSSFAFKAENGEDILRKVGAELRVRTVLEGSVRQVGDKLRITTQLINVADGYQLWSEEYNGDMKDILSVESDVARRVVDALKIKLGVGEARSLTKKATENPEAYRLYLLGRYRINKSTEADAAAAVRYFEQAIQLDPTFALAYCGLADVYGAKAGNAMPSREAWAKQKVLAHKALELDPDLAEAHLSLATALAGAFDWSGAEREVRRALELNPNLAAAYDASAWLSIVFGRFDQAIAEDRKALELDPLNPYLNDSLGWNLYWTRRYDEAIRQLRDNIELYPADAFSHFALGWCLIKKGNLTEAEAELEKATKLDDLPWYIGWLGYTYAVSGDRVKAEQILRDLDELAKRRYVTPNARVPVYLGLGDKEKTLDGLEKSYKDQDGVCWQLKIDHRYDSLRDDPRFAALEERIIPAREFTESRPASK